MASNQTHTKEYREKVIAGLLQDREFLKSAIPTLQAGHFEETIHQAAVEAIIGEYGRSGAPPSKAGLLNELVNQMAKRDRVKDGDRKMLVIAPAEAFVKAVFQPIGAGFNDVKASYLEWAKSQEVKGRAAELFNGLESGTLDLEGAIGELQAIQSRVGLIGKEGVNYDAVTFSAVTPTTVKWLWKGRIPLGKLTVLDGDPGNGKSIMTLDLAARVTRGSQMPDGTDSDLKSPADVVIIQAEDDLSDTAVPRFIAAGGDVTRIHQLKNTEVNGVSNPVTLRDTEAIRKMMMEKKAKLLIIDPFMAYIAGAKSADDAEIRALLNPLMILAAELHFAVVIVRHLNKSGGDNPMYRGGGSIAIIGACRAGLMVAPDPDDTNTQNPRRILAPTKMNLAPKAESIAYNIVETSSGHPRLDWLGAVEHDAKSLLAKNGGGERKTVLEQAQEFLQEFLKDGPRPATEVQAVAKLKGISERTLDDAKKLLEVDSEKTGKQWLWSLATVQAGIAAAS